MAIKEDLRVTKTKAALTNAFYDMLKEMPIEDVTVNQLCTRADVRRATFYKHFKDKSDFLNYLIKDLRNRFDNETWQKDLNGEITKEYYIKYAEAVINYLASKEDAVCNILLASVRPTFVDAFIRQNYEDTKRRLEQSVRGGAHLVASPNVVASMLIGGVGHAIVCWLESENKCPPEALLKDIANIIDKVFA